MGFVWKQKKCCRYARSIWDNSRWKPELATDLAFMSLLIQRSLATQKGRTGNHSVNRLGFLCGNKDPAASLKLSVLACLCLCSRLLCSGYAYVASRVDFHLLHSDLHYYVLYITCVNFKLYSLGARSRGSCPS